VYLARRIQVKSGISRIRELIMGVPPATPPGEDPHAAAAWAETPFDTVLEQAEEAVASGDLPRALMLVETVLRRPSLSVRESADAWDLRLGIAVSEGDRAAAGRAVEEMAARLATGEVRQRVRMAWQGRAPDPEFENALLALASGGGGHRTDAPEPRVAPDASVRKLLDAIGADPDLGDVGAPDPEAAELFFGETTLYGAEDLRSPVEPERVEELLADDAAEGALPLLPGTELASRTPGEIHRIVADHPGASGRELLRRYASEQARRTSPEELQHSYDLAVELFGQEAWEEAAHLLLPVATIENPERVGGLELLARSLFELDRLPQAEAYLKEAVPLGRKLRDPAYAPLFYWLGKIAEERGDPGGAVDYYASAVKLAPDLVEAKRRLQALLAL
jgi:tetratricopeptide (TPR) repeat protein